MNILQYAKESPSEQAELTRLLLVGPAGWGKSTSSATFPQPVWVDVDNNVPPEIKPKLKHVIPLWNRDFLTNNAFGGITPEVLVQYPLNFFPRILSDARDLTAEYTLVVDNLSAISELLATMISNLHAKAIEKNSYHFWNVWAAWLNSLFIGLKSLKCHVILIAHEDEIRDNETNRVLNRRWLLDGKKFTPKMGSYFNNIFRQTRIEEKASQFAVQRSYENMNSAVTTLKYMWQVLPDQEFDVARTTIKTNKLFVPAMYQSFLTKQ
jgi:hypothetical protein